MPAQRTRQSLAALLLIALAMVLTAPAAARATSPPAHLHAVSAATSDDAASDIAATVARDLSQLEAEGDFDALYDRIHPDAAAIVPRAAVVGWFTDVWAPLGPGVATITGVSFDAWSWGVTGITYPGTAVVAFEQPFADGSVRSDTVRLVQDDTGEWRWFFGRDRAFVDEQIARYAPAVATTPPPAPTIDDIDAFWARAFATAGIPYTAPTVVAVDAPIESACGWFDPAAGPGAYCPIDQTIYDAASWRDQLVAGGAEFAWLTVIAHEWGHHIQGELGLRKSDEPDDGAVTYGIDLELQADCLAGAYAGDADARGLLAPGDLAEAQAISFLFGDSPLVPADQPGAHGTHDQRASAFMNGYEGGMSGCGVEV